MHSTAAGWRGWVLAAPLVALPLACGEDRAPAVPETNTAASAGTAGTSSAGRAGSAQGAEGGEAGNAAGQAGELGGGNAGEPTGVGGSGGSGATGGSSSGRGGAGGGDGGATSVGGGHAEGGAAAEGGDAGERGAGATGGIAGVGGTAGDTAGVGGTAGDAAGVGGTAGDAAGVGGTAGASGTAGTAGTGGAPPECIDASDCDSSRGESPCGVWACTSAGRCEAESPGCTDADGDGYGAGAACACAELDCDDTTPTVGGRLAVPEVCYSGAAPTRGVGICRDGMRYCHGGDCLGEVGPAPEACNQEDDDCDGVPDEELGEYTCGVGACSTSTAACVEGTVDQCTYRRQTNTDGCNGIDDDCDGGIDEDCPATCLKVALTGDDTAAAVGGGATPFRNVQTAIDYAASNPNAPQRVCIASGVSCASGTTARFEGPAGSPLTMRNGIHVLGKFESTGWTRCANGANVATVLAPTTAHGVLFSAAVTDQTVLFGVTVERAALTTTAGVTLDGAKNALLAGVIVNNAIATAESSYGVNVVNGADAHLFQCTVSGGRGSVETIGVRVAGAKALIEESTVSGKAALGDGFSMGVLFDSAPGSRITGSTVSANHARPDWDVMGVLVTGDATGVVLDHSTVSAFHPRAYDARTAVGIGLYDCDGTPWVTTSDVTANGLLMDEATGIGIDAEGCNPSIDQNTSIHAYRQGMLGGTGSGPFATGVRCSTDDPLLGCTVSGNRSISGETWSGGRIANVFCPGSGCARVSRNELIGRRAEYGQAPSGGSNCQSSACGRAVTGISGGRFVDLNNIEAGCSLRSTGISGGRTVIGNVVRGHTTDDCHRSGPGPNDPLIPMATGELGVTGWYLDSNSVTVAETTHIESSGVYRALTAARGVYLRNSFDAYDDDPVVVEGATPFRFQNNRVRGGGGLYRDLETNTTLTTAAEINALTDMITGGNTQ